MPWCRENNVRSAGEQSGARIQARRAVAHGRPVILTDLVVRASQWPTELIGRPAVHVATSTAEVMDIAESIASEPAKISGLFTVAAADE